MSLNVPLESDFSARKLRIAGACLIGMTFGTYFAIFGAMSFLMLPITQEFHWTRLQFSYAISAMMWSGAIAMPVMGRLADRLGVRIVAAVVTLFLGGFTLVISRQVGHVWSYYLCVALTGVFGQASIIYNKVIGALFTRHRGKALGIFYVAITPGQALMPQITNTLLIHVGWRGVFFSYGILILAIVPLLYFWLEEPGSTAPNHSLGRARLGRFAALKGSPAALRGMAASEARKDKTFWILVASSLSAGALATGWVQHHVAFLVSRGFTPTQVASVISISFLLLPLATFSSGYVMDRIHTAKIAAPFALLGAVGMWIEWETWSNFGGVPLLLLGVTLCGFSLGSAYPIQTYFFTRYFGIKSFAEIYGSCMAMHSFATGFGPPLIGKLFDRTGSYKIVIFVIATGYVLSAILILTLGPYRYALDLREPEPAPAVAEQVSHARLAN
jgi:MFS family permease